MEAGEHWGEMRLGPQRGGHRSAPGKAPDFHSKSKGKSLKGGTRTVTSNLICISNGSSGVKKMSRWCEQEVGRLGQRQQQRWRKTIQSVPMLEASQQNLLRSETWGKGRKREEVERAPGGEWRRSHNYRLNYY